MIAHLIALFEALTVSDLEAARPTDLERFAAHLDEPSTLSGIRSP